MSIFPEIDNFDWKILQILSRNGRATNAELAEAVGLSTSSCQRRVKEMEARGIIRGYTANIAPEALDKGFTVFVTVRMANHQRDQLIAFQKAIATIPQITEAHSIAGSFEYLLRVDVADLTQYKDVHADQLAALPGVGQITSYISINRVKP